MGVSDSPLRDRVIFVEGVPRSGTTWLVSLLGLHPQVAAMSNETHLFDIGVDRLFANVDRQDRRFLSAFVSRTEVVNLVRDLCDGVLLLMRDATKPGAAFVAENTPVPASAEAGSVVARKLECYPDAWYVHIVRDGREVARSLARMPWMGGRPEASCYELWQSCRDAIRTGLSGARYREVSYAELVADPAGRIAEVVDWIGLGDDPVYLAGVSEASRVRYDVWAGATAQDSATRRAPTRVVRTARRAVGRLVRERVKEPAIDQSVEIARRFMDALRHPSDERLRSATTEGVTVTLTGAGSAGLQRATATGDDARRILLDVGQRVFRPRLTNEKWSAASGTWVNSDGVPSITGVLSGTRGDGSHVELFLALVLDDERVDRAMLFVAERDA
jgi:sulfotransferase family protein